MGDSFLPIIIVHYRFIARGSLALRYTIFKSQVAVYTGQDNEG